VSILLIHSYSRRNVVEIGLPILCTNAMQRRGNRPVRSTSPDCSNSLSGAILRKRAFNSIHCPVEMLQKWAPPIRILSATLRRVAPLSGYSSSILQNGDSINRGPGATKFGPIKRTSLCSSNFCFACWNTCLLLEKFCKYFYTMQCLRQSNFLGEN